MKLNGQRLSRPDLERCSGDLSAAGGVRKVILDDGSERGVRVLEFRTGSGLAFDVVVDRAMDFGQAEHQGRAFGWCSPTGVRHPGLHENADEDGVAWLRSFSGLQTTGGLDHIFAAAQVDASQYRYPLRKTMHHGLHGTGGQHSCPSPRVRRVLGRRPLLTLGGRRNPASRRLWRASAPAPQN